MGLACLKTKRCYYGSEIDDEVQAAASYRLARLITMLGKPSFAKCIVAQVSTHTHRKALKIIIINK